MCHYEKWNKLTKEDQNIFSPRQYKVEVKHFEESPPQSKNAEDRSLLLLWLIPGQVER